MELFNSVLCIWCLDPAYAVCGQILRELFVDLSFISREGCQQGKSIHYSKLSFLSSVRHFSPLIITSLLRHIKSLRLDTQYFDIFLTRSTLCHLYYYVLEVRGKTVYMAASSGVESIENARPLSKLFVTCFG